MNPPANPVQPVGVFAREHGLNVSTRRAAATLKKRDAVPGRLWREPSVVEGEACSLGRRNGERCRRTVPDEDQQLDERRKAVTRAVSRGISRCLCLRPHDRTRDNRSVPFAQVRLRPVDRSPATKNLPTRRVRRRPGSCAARASSQCDDTSRRQQRESGLCEPLHSRPTHRVRRRRATRPWPGPVFLVDPELGHTSSMFLGRQPGGSLGALAAIVAVSCFVSGSANALAGPSHLRAFQRPARVSDAVPRALLSIFSGRFGPVAASRRIATATGFRGRASLYLVRLRDDHTCVIETLPPGGAGAGCVPSRQFLPVKRPLSAGEGGRFLYGVVANNITRVAFLDPRARSHAIRLTRDGGFLYACRHRNGCVGLVSAVNGYDRHGRLVFHESM